MVFRLPSKMAGSWCTRREWLAGGGGCLSPDSESEFLVTSIFCVPRTGSWRASGARRRRCFVFVHPKLRSEMLFDEDDKLGRVGHVGHLVSCVTRQLHWGVCHQQQQPAAKGVSAAMLRCLDDERNAEDRRKCTPGLFRSARGSRGIGPR